MIIFDLGTLADCEHRRHFIDATGDHPDYFRPPCPTCNDGSHHKIDPQYHKITNEKWQPEWQLFYEACDQDKPIKQAIETFLALAYEPFKRDVRIWSGRSESVREKTIKWIQDNIPEFEGYSYIDRILKMRPIGDNTPDDQLKERWLDEYLDQPLYPQLEKPIPGEIKEYRRKEPIQFVIDSDPESIAMYRKRGIFVFDCNQNR